MNYPLISEYIEAIKSAEDNFQELAHLRAVLGGDGQPVMTSGNFSVVFKMKDEETGKLYALKCFTKEQEGRAEAYRQIAEELMNVDSPYLVSIRFLEKELFVDTEQTDETEFPVLLMDWVEGKTLDKFVRENLNDKYTLEMLAYRFSQLAQWLIPQSFAHGDLKPDNILVREDSTLVLVDYDGMYVPAMKGQKARELGSPDFRHPLRTEDDFDEHIDDFPLISMLLSLKAISLNPDLLEQFGASERLLFSQSDYMTGRWCAVVDTCYFYYDNYLTSLAALLAGLCKYQCRISLPPMQYPYKLADFIPDGFKGRDLLSINAQQRLNIKEPKSVSDILDACMDLDCFMKTNEVDYVISGSLGLYLHGLTLPSFIPHDIDVRIYVNKRNKSSVYLFLKNVADFCMSNYNVEYPENMFTFWVKRHFIKINAFIVDNSNSPNDESVEMLVNGSKIKVHNALAILKEKYRLKREKDFLYNNLLQMKMNSFFVDSY